MSNIVTTDGDSARLMAMPRLQFEDPIVYSNHTPRIVTGKFNFHKVYNEVAKDIEANSAGNRVRVKNTTGGTLNPGTLIYLAATKLTTQTTGTASSSPSAGENVLISISQTFEVGQIVKITSGGYTEYSLVTAVVASTSVTVDILLKNHTTPTITALPAFEFSLATATGAYPAAWVTDTELSDAEYGWAYDCTKVVGIDTSSFALEDLLYLSITAGAVVNAAPTAANTISQVVGVVTVVGGVGSGEAYMFPGRNRILRVSSDMLPADISSFAVRNETGSTIIANSLVYITGYSYTHSSFLIALATTATPKLAEGIVTAEILNNANGTCYLSATVNNINTSSYSSVGDPVYLSTSGTFTNTKNDIAQVVGRVRIINASTGSIVFTLQRKEIVSLSGDDIMAGIRVKSTSAPSAFAHSSGSGVDTYIRGQDGYATGNNNGASLVIKPGAKTNSGVDGEFKVESPGSGTDTISLGADSSYGRVISNKPIRIKSNGVDQLEIQDDAVLMHAIASAAGTHTLKWDNSTKEVTYDTSDERVKKVQSALDKYGWIQSILRINPKLFYQGKQTKDGKIEYDTNMEPKFGFIAQDIHKIYPSIVHAPEDGLWNYDDRALLAILWLGVQELARLVQPEE